MIKFPWENNEKPAFVNEQGFEWYPDRESTRYARQKNSSGISLKNVYVFYVKKEEDITRVIIDDKQNVLANNKNLEQIGFEIDKLKLLKQTGDRNIY